MPTIPPKNYISKIDEFVAHWTAANSALPSTIILTSNFGNTTFQTDRTALIAQITAVEAAINTNQGAIATRDMLRASVKERIRQFNAFVRGAFPRNQYPNMLPNIPQLNVGAGTWMKAMADVNNVWTQINAITPVPAGAPVPMILTGTYTLALFTTDQAALNAAFTAIETTQTNVETAIRQRDVLFNALYERMKEYRRVAQGRFASTEALYQSIPALTPAPGHTPAPVNVSAVWSAPLIKAVVTYTESTDPDLQEYELRGSFGGTKYSESSAVVLGNHAAGVLTPFQTDDGLVASGSKVFYKVFVILTTGNEKGSATVSVTRP
ncbi:MAG: hypothetical protein ACAH95_06235 [Fimbriimonas sp.]